MKHARQPPAVTSLPQAPQDEAKGRVRRYGITMAIRIACFVLMILVTPYGWYTWVFAIAAAVLPYIAVVFANAVAPTSSSPAESPTMEITAHPGESTTPSAPNVITLSENPEGESR